MFYLGIINPFTIFQLRVRYFVIKTILVLNILPKLGLTCFKSNWIDKNEIFLEIKILQLFQNDVVINFNNVIRIVHCALNIESAQPVSIRTFEWTLLVTKIIRALQLCSMVIKIHGMKDLD